MANEYIFTVQRLVLEVTSDCPLLVPQSSSSFLSGVFCITKRWSFERTPLYACDSVHRGR